VALPAVPPAPRRAHDGRSRRARLAGDLAPLLPILAISFLVSSTDGSRPVAVAVYAADQLAAAPSDLGLLFGTIGLSFTLGQVALVGPLIDRFGERTAIALSAFVTAIGFLLVPFTTGLLPLAGALVIQGVGMALGFAAIPAYISHTTASGQGVAMGWRSATQSAGQVVGPIVGGWLYELDHAWPAFAAAAVGLTAALVGVVFLRPLVGLSHDHPVPAPSVQEPVT
jgi:MFS family permease